MPIINGEEVITLSAAQLDELFFNIDFGAVDYKTLQPTTHTLFSNQSVAAGTTSSPSTGIRTGNNAKMQIMFKQTGSSTNCTMNLYGSSHEDLSNAGIIATLTLGVGGNPVSLAIEPSWIPEYTYGELINKDPSNQAIGTLEVTTWVRP
ncbi:MAG: hypothetical protein PHW84_02020 [Methanosarcina sp.]|nr:hypothetical protein [Methanosarcina sp.]